MAEIRGDDQPAPEIIRDARGIYWRSYPAGLAPEAGLTEPMLSMVPVSDDNDPVPEPWTTYAPIGVAAVYWRGIALRLLAENQTARALLDRWQDGWSDGSEFPLLDETRAFVALSEEQEKP